MTLLLEVSKQKALGIRAGIALEMHPLTWVILNTGKGGF
jgi:hypothetical protein